MFSTLEKVNAKTLQTSISLTSIRIADEALSKLNYPRFKNVVAPKPLLETLLKLDIVPFTNDSIHQYKKKKEYVGMWSGTKRFIWQLSVSPVLVILSIYMGSICSGVSEHEAFKGAASFILSLLLGVAAIINTIWVFCNSDVIGTGYQKIIQWDRVELRNFQADIPEFVLNKAIQIKDACPKAYFEVDFLYEKHEFYQKPKPDPFLVVSLGLESYYVEVWNEKKYERSI